MDRLPDAPWIQEAERLGMPADDKIECPECGEVCREVYMSRENDTVYGCERCIKRVDSWEWMYEMLKAEAEANQDDS